jgi:hypothetical protein
VGKKVGGIAMGKGVGQAMGAGVGKAAGGRVGVLRRRLLLRDNKFVHEIHRSSKERRLTHENIKEVRKEPLSWGLAACLSEHSNKIFF